MNRFQAQSRKEKNTNILNSFKLYDRNTELINKIKNLLTEHSFSSSTIHVGNSSTPPTAFVSFDDSAIIVTINKLAYKDDFVETFRMIINENDIVHDSLFETIKQKMDKEIFNFLDETDAQYRERMRIENRPSPTPLPRNYK